MFEGAHKMVALKRFEKLLKNKYQVKMLVSVYQIYMEWYAIHLICTLTTVRDLGFLSLRHSTIRFDTKV